MVSKTEQLVATSGVMLCEAATLMMVPPLMQAEFLNRSSHGAAPWYEELRSGS
jgi:hypothetical protein